MRRPSAVVVVLAAVVGVAVVAVPGGRVATLVLAGAGVVTVLAAGVGLLGSGVARYDPLPDPADRPRSPRPGDEFADRLAEVGWTDRRRDPPGDRETLRADLASLARAVLARTDGTGADPVEALPDRAGALFAEGAVPSLSTRERLRALRSGDPPFARRCRAAVAALAARAGVDDCGDRPARRRRSSPEEWPTPDGAVRPTGRDRGVAAVALFVAGVGVLARRPGLVLAALVGVTFVAALGVASAPTPAVTVRRRVDATDPSPGDRVTVTLRVDNDGDRALPDLRVVDGVPTALEVVDGSPDLATALAPGGSARTTYAVRARRGEHRFRPSLVAVRDALSATERRVAVAAASDGRGTDAGRGRGGADSGDGTATTADDDATLVRCVPALGPPVDPPVRRRPTPAVGAHRSPTTGGGVEFDGVRPYRRGDPLARVDWAHLAATGDLATVQFREPRRRRLVVAVDARRPAYVADGDGSAVERSLTGAGRLVAGALAADRPVGIAALSPREAWLPPGSGPVHRRRLRERLATAPAFDPVAPATSDTGDGATLADRLDDAEAVVVTPLVDDGAVDAVGRLAALDVPVTVVSPDPTDGRDAADIHAALERWCRIGDLRATGVTVVDWSAGTHLERALDRARARRPSSAAHTAPGGGRW